jgi:hypothetical protein
VLENFHLTRTIINKEKRLCLPIYQSRDDSENKQMSLQNRCFPDPGGDTPCGTKQNGRIRQFVSFCKIKGNVSVNVSDVLNLVLNISHHILDLFYSQHFKTKANRQAMKSAIRATLNLKFAEICRPEEGSKKKIGLLHLHHRNTSPQYQLHG